jgi:hypothetical protein
MRSSLTRLSALCLAVAPVVLAVATAVDPEVGDNTGTAPYRDHPVSGQWHGLLLHWAMLLFVPGLAGLLMAVRHRGAVLARVAWVAATVGLVTFSGLMATDIILLAVAQAVPNDQVEAFSAGFDPLHLMALGWQLPGVLGFFLSFLITPIAAARARVIRWWTAALALPGTVAYIMLTTMPVPVSLIGPALLAVAYWTAAWRLLRQPAGVSEVDTFGPFRRRFGAVAMVAAPVLFVAGLAIAPRPADLAGLAAQPTRAQVSGLLLHLAFVLFVPAVWGLAERGRRGTQVAGGLTVLGLGTLAALPLNDFAYLAAYRVLGERTASVVDANLGGYALSVYGWNLPGLVLTLGGLVAVTVVAWRDKLVTWWVPALVVAGAVGYAAF